MEILNKELNRKNYLGRKKISIYPNLKCLLQLSTNWTLNQSCRPPNGPEVDSEQITCSPALYVVSVAYMQEKLWEDIKVVIKTSSGDS